MEIRDEPHQGDQQLHNRILDRNAFVASTTAASQHQPADDRDILRRRDLVTALRASGARFDDAQAFRPTPNANIQKRADGGSDQKNEQTFQKFHLSSKLVKKNSRSHRDIE